MEIGNWKLKFSNWKLKTLRNSYLMDAEKEPERFTLKARLIVFFKAAGVVNFQDMINCRAS
jgi:hypothetical protein